MDGDVPPGFPGSAAPADDVPPGFTVKKGPGAATAPAAGAAAAAAAAGGPPPGISAPAAGNGAAARLSEGLSAHLQQSAKVSLHPRRCDADRCLGVDLDRVYLRCRHEVPAFSVVSLKHSAKVCCAAVC